MRSLIRFLMVSAFGASMVASQQNGGCAKVTVRKEIRQLSTQEWDDFVNAVKALHTGPPPTIYDKFVDIHLQNVPVAHAIPGFFPWHRMFVKAFEQQLQQINPNVAVPYWDWPLDSQAPEKSVIWSTKHFGSSGDASCVSDGPFAGWIMNTPQPHCLRRKWNKGKQISALYPPELLSRILNEAKSYSEFRTAIEAAPHGLVHVNIGSDGGDLSTMWSPNDPIFWVHHAFVDKIWTDFQLLKPDVAGTYDGKDKSNRTVTLNDIVTPFNVRVSDVLNTNNSPLCYRYTNPLLTTRGYVKPTATQANTATNQPANGNSRNTAGKKRSIGLELDCTIDADDRSDQTGLRTPHSLPDEWVEMMELNPERVRAMEDQYAIFINSLNEESSYVSPISLSRHSSTIKKFVNGKIETLNLFDGISKIPGLNLSSLVKIGEPVVKVIEPVVNIVDGLLNNQEHRGRKEQPSLNSYKTEDVLGIKLAGLNIGL
ncbi:hypothetical protein K7432_005953 [Basidiobolus ranarum]|uniref:Tyrosinase copper-binding domain-containing protein n=1 Tax=Basidiobolus ranarum TaxID=34480 RepID=A0ABR2WVS4_9FUNG